MSRTPGAQSVPGSPRTAQEQHGLADTLLSPPHHVGAAPFLQVTLAEV